MFTVPLHEVQPEAPRSKRGERPERDIFYVSLTLSVGGCNAVVQKVFRALPTFILDSLPYRVCSP